MFYKDAEEFKQTNGYTIDGIWYPRVTKILEIKSKSGLDMFFKEVDSYAMVEAVKTRSALEGSMVHAAIQGLLTGGAPLISPEIAPAINSFQQFNANKGIVFHK